MSDDCWFWKTPIGRLVHRVDMAIFRWRLTGNIRRHRRKEEKS